MRRAFCPVAVPTSIADQGLLEPVFPRVQPGQGFVPSTRTRESEKTATRQLPVQPVISPPGPFTLPGGLAVGKVDSGDHSHPGTYRDVDAVTVHTYED